jgi:hypothetical protein
MENKSIETEFSIKEFFESQIQNSEKPNELHRYSIKDGKKICILKPDVNIKPFLSENYEDVRKKFNELE